MSKTFQDEDRDWNNFYNAMKDRPPRETLIKALSFFEADNSDENNLIAFDIGCGTGIDTFELLRRGWKVYASDKEQKAIDIIINNTDEIYKDNLITSVATFDEIDFIKADLINAGMSLPFCNPEKFSLVWNMISDSVNSGGRFSGNFFGEKDSWNKFNDMTFHTRQQVESMFEKFETEYFHERDEDGETATGEKKHWHVFSVVARKK
jgi:SAM-dependent methyltransferase